MERNGGIAVIGHAIVPRRRSEALRGSFAIKYFINLFYYVLFANLQLARDQADAAGFGRMWQLRQQNNAAQLADNRGANDMGAEIPENQQPRRRMQQIEPEEDEENYVIRQHPNQKVFQQFVIFHVDTVQQEKRRSREL